MLWDQYLEFLGKEGSIQKMRKLRGLVVPFTGKTLRLNVVQAVTPIHKPHLSSFYDSIIHVRSQTLSISRKSTDWKGDIQYEETNGDECKRINKRKKIHQFVSKGKVNQRKSLFQVHLLSKILDQQGSFKAEVQIHLKSNQPKLMTNKMSKCVQQLSVPFYCTVS